jgi:hypothetical protein
MLYSISSPTPRILFDASHAHKYTEFQDQDLSIARFETHLPVVSRLDSFLKYTFCLLNSADSETRYCQGFRALCTLWSRVCPSPYSYNITLVVVAVTNHHNGIRTPRQIPEIDSKPSLGVIQRLKSQSNHLCFSLEPALFVRLQGSGLPRCDASLWLCFRLFLLT